MCRLRATRWWRWPHSAPRQVAGQRKMMRLANTAAGIVVSKVGTAVVTAQELDEALEAEAHQSDPSKGASLSLDEAVRRREEWRKRGLKVGFTNGCYDLLHPGHVSLLQRAAAECDRLMSRSTAMHRSGASKGRRVQSRTSAPGLVFWAR